MSQGHRLHDMVTDTHTRLASQQQRSASACLVMLVVVGCLPAAVVWTSAAWVLRASFRNGGSGGTLLTQSRTANQHLKLCSSREQAEQEQEQEGGYIRLVVQVQVHSCAHSRRG